MEDLNFLQHSFDDTETVPEVVLVEDDRLFAISVKKFLEKKLQLKVNYFSRPSECIDALSLKPNQKFCLLTDITFDNASSDGLALIDLLNEKNHKFVSIAMTGFASIETAINATKKGVFHYLTKPFELDVLLELVVKAFSEGLGIPGDQILRSEQCEVPSFLSRQKFEIERPNKEDIFCGMIGRSKKMKAVFERITRVAASDSTVLINGPSGTGKELVAKAIHQLSQRKNNALVSINCGAIPSELLESELFGHVKGAFTGASSTRLGRFEVADKGTIFLDEIGDMPQLLQVKILRVLQNRQVEMVGGNVSKDVDVRIITATHRDLEKSVESGTFREDLFYRLNVIPVRLPALCDRREDIPLLVSFFLSKFVSADGSNNIRFADRSWDALMGYSWPGNVRELENLIERLVILKGGGEIFEQDLPAKLLVNRPISYVTDGLMDLPDDGLDLKKFVSEIEDHLIIQALSKTSGNKNQASKLLKMNRTTLIEKMKKKGLMEILS